MCSNWAFLSGCESPSLSLRFPCRLYPPREGVRQRPDSSPHVLLQSARQRAFARSSKSTAAAIVDRLIPTAPPNPASQPVVLDHDRRFSFDLRPVDELVRDLSIRPLPLHACHALSSNAKCPLPALPKRSLRVRVTLLRSQPTADDFARQVRRSTPQTSSESCRRPHTEHRHAFRKCASYFLTTP